MSVYLLTYKILTAQEHTVKVLWDEVRNHRDRGYLNTMTVAYLKWLKDQLGRRETMDKLLSFRNDLIEANKRVNYRNQIHRINNEIQRDNLAHNSFEHLQHQINQFGNLNFTLYNIFLI